MAFMTPSFFRKTVKWSGLLLLAHIVSWFIYDMALASTVVSLLAEGDLTAVAIVIIYDVIFDAAFVTLCLKFKLSYDNIDIGKEIKENVRSNDFSVIDYFKTNMLKEHLIKIGVVALFQIPLVIFYAAFKMLLSFYAMDWSGYLLCGSALLGWLLSTLIFAIVFTAVVLIFLLLTKKDVQNNMLI